MSWDYNYPLYVSAAEKRDRCEKAAKTLAQKGRKLAPICIEGRTIARSFWGKAWCDNLESYSDYASRLPRGRAYARNGSILDLQVCEGLVTALVQGSELYNVKIKVAPVDAVDWADLKRECAGHVSSLIDLLQGKLSAQVMGMISRRGGGLFPEPSEIKLSCSCPDSASMCKHVAAALYGIGARLDHNPELIFKMRGVDHLELVSEATKSISTGSTTTDADTLADSDLSDIFGLEINPVVPLPAVHKE
ncbi:MAG: zinc finger, SWIM-type, partial [Chthoniobacteraceae bacterium]|nr:zinc finger, SWIM-type [Chthoniobacteraceae bacterium]